MCVYTYIYIYIYIHACKQFECRGASAQDLRGNRPESQPGYDIL